MTLEQWYILERECEIHNIETAFKMRKNVYIRKGMAELRRLNRLIKMYK